MLLWFYRLLWAHFHNILSPYKSIINFIPKKMYMSQFSLKLHFSILSIELQKHIIMWLERDNDKKNTHRWNFSGLLPLFIWCHDKLKVPSLKMTTETILHNEITTSKMNIAYWTSWFNGSILGCYRYFLSFAVTSLTLSLSFSSDRLKTELFIITKCKQYARLVDGSSMIQTHTITLFKIK